jgi:hypothetical protein
MQKILDVIPVNSGLSNHPVKRNFDNLMPFPRNMAFLHCRGWVFGWLRLMLAPSSFGTPSDTLGRGRVLK